MSYDLGTATGRIELEYRDGRAAERAHDDLQRVERQAHDTDDALRQLGGRLGTVFRGVARGAGIAALAGGMASAAISAGDLTLQIAGIIPELASVASLSAALPALFAGAAASVGVLKAAFSGVGETVKLAFDPDKLEEFNEALEKLSPAAREFALAIKDNVPFLTEFQQQIQEAFFSSSQLAGQVPRAMRALDSLRPVLLSLTDRFGELTLQLTNFALSADSIDFLKNSIIAFREAVESASGGMLPLLAGIRDVGEVGANLLPRLGAAIRNVATNFGEWLTEISNSGQLQEWIETGIATLKTLGGIISNVGSLLTSLFQAANETSGGLLQAIEGVTGEFADFLNTAEGIEAITSLFSGLAEVAGQLAPIVTTLVSVLAKALGPALTRIATEVGPVLLEMIETLAPAFGPLANAIADVLIAIAPLLPPLAQLVSLIAQALAGGLSAAAAQLGPLIEMLGSTLLAALQELGPVLQEGLVRLLPLAAEAGLELAAAFAPLMPLLVELGAALAQAILDNMPAIVSIMERVVPLMVELGTTIAGTLGPALEALIPMIPTIVGAFVTMLDIFWRIQGFIIGVEVAFLRFLGVLRNLPGTIQGAIGGALAWLGEQLGALRERVGEAVTGIGDFFAKLPGRVGAALRALPGIIINTISNAVNRAAFLVGAGIGLMINHIRAMPGRARAALAALPGIIANLISSAWNAARNFTIAGVNNIVAVARTLPGRARSAVNALVSNLRSIASNSWAGVRNQFIVGVNNAVALARTLPGRIRGALGNLGGVLVQAGRNLVMGLVNGIKGAVGAAVNAAVNVGRSVINGIKSTLKIGSPSKVMIEVGEDTTEGYAIGILNELKKVQAAARAVVKSVVTPTTRQITDPTRSMQPMPPSYGFLPVRRGEDAPAPQGVQGATEYIIRIGEKTVATMVLDAITGQPVAVKHVTDEGSRRNEWAGSGR